MLFTNVQPSRSLDCYGDNNGNTSKWNKTYLKLNLGRPGVYLNLKFIQVWRLLNKCTFHHILQPYFKLT